MIDLRLYKTFTCKNSGLDVLPQNKITFCFMFWDAQIWNFETLNWIMLGKWKHKMIFEEQSSSCTSDCNDE